MLYLTFIGNTDSLNALRVDGENLRLVLDYTIPQYRDFTVGKYLFSRLPEYGFRTVTYQGSVENHAAYLKNTGFVEENGVYKKTL